jgi:hypothetical protein
VAKDLNRLGFEHRLIETDIDANHARRIEKATNDIDIEEYDKLEATDFAGIARALNPAEYSQITATGCISFDCVKKMARSLHEINPNTLVDMELTEWFKVFSYTQNGFFDGKYDPAKAYKAYEKIMGYSSDAFYAQMGRKSFALPYFGGIKTKEDTLGK